MTEIKNGAVPDNVREYPVPNLQMTHLNDRGLFASQKTPADHAGVEPCMDYEKGVPDGTPSKRQDDVWVRSTVFTRWTPGLPGQGTCHRPR